MKKSGFTLAEVLITLAIIGVVATLTLPALMTNTGEQQYKTALKKGINTLTEAGQMSSAMAGFDYSSLTDLANTTTTLGNMAVAKDGEQSLFGILSERANIDYNLSGLKGLKGEDSNVAIFFRDGMAIAYDSSNSALNTTLERDNISHGLPIILDVNGNKGPNLYSNCDGNTVMTTASNTGSGQDSSICTKNKRVIKDRFAVRLRGVYAVPNDAVARWVYEN